MIFLDQPLRKNSGRVACTSLREMIFRRPPSSQKKHCRSPPAVPKRITSQQSNACHVPKNGQARRRPSEPPGPHILFYLDFVSMILQQEGAAGRLFFQKKLLSHETDRIGVLKFVVFYFVSTVEESRRGVWL